MLDRIYLNGYVPKLQVGGQVITFLHDHRGMRRPIRPEQPVEMVAQDTQRVLGAALTASTLVPSPEDMASSPVASAWASTPAGTCPASLPQT